VFAAENAACWIALLCQQFSNQTLARIVYVENMAGEAANIAMDSGRAWLREGTRAAILQAARKLFDKGGVEMLSLGAVASETGFAPPTVYAYFTNKNDLLVATVANDLAELARAMRDVYPFADPQSAREPVHAVPDEDTDVANFTQAALEQMPVEREEQLDAAAPVQEEAPREPQLFDTLPNPNPERFSSLAINLPVVGKKRRLLERREIALEPLPVPEMAEAPALMPHPERAQEEVQTAAPEPAPADDELASLKESVAKLETRKVDAWLERRLRVFEKSLTDIETRLVAAEQNSTRAAAVADESSKILSQRLEGAEKRLRDGLDNLAQRLENSEKRPRGIPPDLRATINDLYTRLETLEGGHGAAKSSTALEAQWSAAPEETPAVSDVVPAEPGKPITATAETYLTAARRAASAAAQLAEIENKPRRFAAVSPKRWSRANLIVALCGALVLLLVVYGFILRDYFVSQTSQPASPAPMHHALLNPPDAVERTTALADRGNMSAELMLGLDYLNGTGVTKSPTQAARWLQLAAEGGEPVAQYWFGTLYERGIGVRPDSALAFHWYQTAAMQGNRRAIYDVAIAYAVGRGVARDMGQAAGWFKRAAQLGYVDAQYNLGVLYERGDGVPESLDDAYKWYAIAAAGGDAESKSRIAAIATQLSPDDLSAAQSAAASFKPEPLNKAANLLPDLPAHG
jgi:TPR repeat protein